ncbi:MAG: biotin--[acetyl-CoA-carboxylase] ligase [Cytophagales bacterium CG18_big_fil_WC_8_21_14_2_50_42_9]|nr:MAG: biotin--[acetyl-CoA-carboxylase] ligase [Cytophagales bacterium CG18_big_fil_WC_8_21_14_2_50_42_9]
MAPKTLFTGQQLVYLPQCDSTNNIAHDLLIKNKATEGCVVITSAQTRGRGQRGNSWEAEPGKNITLSVVLKPSFIAVAKQFSLNIAVSLAVADLVKAFLPEQRLKVKWPNDLYYGNKKLGGILIENTISNLYLQHSIIGIGLNINQLSFTNNQAVSLAQLTGEEYALETIIEQLLSCLEVRYLELKQGKLAKQKFEYLQILFHYQEEYNYQIADTIISGKILGVAENGKLGLQVNNEIKYFDFKEISYIL